MGYGPVVPNGYGTSYNPQANRIIFCISSFKDSSITDSTAFADTLYKVLLDMQEVCMKGTAPVPQVRKSSLHTILESSKTNGGWVTQTVELNILSGWIWVYGLFLFDSWPIIRVPVVTIWIRKLQKLLIMIANRHLPPAIFRTIYLQVHNYIIINILLRFRNNYDYDIPEIILWGDKCRLLIETHDKISGITL